MGIRSGLAGVCFHCTIYTPECVCMGMVYPTGEQLDDR